ncbi:retrovirus-related pol polyprotein from transposon TNT 1-94, partial [Tanacetum coccineum]
YTSCVIDLRSNTPRTLTPLRPNLGVLHKKPEYVKSEEKKEDKKAGEKKRDMSKVKCYNYKNEGHFAKDCKKAKVKDYNYYKIKMLLAKKDSDEQVLLAEEQAWMESSSYSDQEINAKWSSWLKWKRPGLYDERVIGKVINRVRRAVMAWPSLTPLRAMTRYTPMFLTHSNEALEIENFKRARENKIEFAYDYGNLNGNLDTLSNVRRPKHSSVIWKKKGSSNTFNVDLSSVSHSKLNKDVKRYSRKDLLSCNNSYHVDTRSAYACNDAMNVSCTSRLYASYDVNDLFIFDDVSIRKSQVSKMPFRKNPRDSLNVHSRSNSNKSLPRTMFRWLPKMQPLAELVAKWIPKIFLWIIDSGCSKHMTGNRALLTNFMEKFLGTVHFGNNDFVVIPSYRDVVIGSMTIKIVYYVEDGVDLLIGDLSSNLYTIALNDIALNSLACLLAKASSS